MIKCFFKELGDRIADKKYARAEDNNAVDSPQNSAKSVSAETLLLSSESQLQYQNDQQEERLTFPQRKADSLIAIVEHYLASSNDSSETDLKLSSLKAAERCQLVLHVRAGSLNPNVGNDVNLNASLNPSLDGRWLIPNAADAWLVMRACWL